MPSSLRNTAFPTLLHVMFKELRIEQRFSQEQVAAALGKQKSGYAKIENGQTQLTLNALSELCAFYGLTESHVLQKAREYQLIMGYQGWVFYKAHMKGDPTMGMPGEQCLNRDHDQLLTLSLEYYALTSISGHKPYMAAESLTKSGAKSVMDGPIIDKTGQTILPDIFNYAMDKKYREHLRQGKQ